MASHGCYVQTGNYLVLFIYLFMTGGYRLIGIDSVQKKSIHFRGKKIEVDDFDYWLMEVFVFELKWNDSSPEILCYLGVCRRRRLKI